MTDCVEVPITVILEQPSLFCTIFHISHGCGTVRLSFGEMLNGESKFRVAVSLPIEQARSLTAALTTLLADAGPHQH